MPAKARAEGSGTGGPTTRRLKLAIPVNVFGVAGGAVSEIENKADSPTCAPCVVAALPHVLPFAVFQTRTWPVIVAPPAWPVMVREPPRKYPLDAKLAGAPNGFN